MDSWPRRDDRLSHEQLKVEIHCNNLDMYLELMASLMSDETCWNKTSKRARGNQPGLSQTMRGYISGFQSQKWAQWCVLQASTDVLNGPHGLPKLRQPGLGKNNEKHGHQRSWQKRPESEVRCSVRALMFRCWSTVKLAICQPWLWANVLIKEVSRVKQRTISKASPEPPGKRTSFDDSVFDRFIDFHPKNENASGFLEPRHELYWLAKPIR